MIRLAPILLLPAVVAGSGKSDDAPAPPPVSLALRIEAPDVSSPWKMTVSNVGNAPVRLVADGRLLRLEVVPPDDDATSGKGGHKKARKPIECKLPLGLRPGAEAEDRRVFLVPGGRYEEIVNPALYCFGKKEREALIAGASVTAKLGFAPPKPRGKKEVTPSAPYVAEPASPDAPFSPVKELLAEPFTLASTPPTPTLAADVPRQDPSAPHLAVSAPPRVEAADAHGVDITVTVRNAGARATKARLRRDDVVFIVDGPQGSVQCGGIVLGRASPPESFATFRASGAQSFAIRLFEPCPDGTFDQPGLYRVRATVTLTDDGERYALHALTGTATQKEPTLVRVDGGPVPFYATPPQVFGPAK